MFSLGDGAKFWLYTKPTDMRKSFNVLSGIVNNDMRQNLYSGDVFVFVNASNNMMKLLRYEPGGLVIYNKRLDHGRMHLVERIQEGDPTITPLEWRRLVDTIQGIIDDPRRRLQGNIHRTVCHRLHISGYLWRSTGFPLLSNLSVPA